MTDTSIRLAIPPTPLTTSTADGRSRVCRSLIAFLVTLSMLLAVSSVAVFAQSATDGGPDYLPTTSIAYAEMRLDLPGDQHDALAAFMAHFPGFADTASFDSKIDQMLDQVVSSASGGSATWTGNIQTWTDGRFSAGLLALPKDAAKSDDSAPQDIVLALSVTDRAALESQRSTLQGTTTPTTEAYAGATIATVGDTSYAVTDRYLLVSPVVADLKTSLDVLAGTTPSLAADPTYQAARATEPADRLGSFYLSTETLKPFIEAQLAKQSGGSAMLAQLDQLPAWVGGYVQVADDHLTMSAATQLASAATMPSVRETDIAAHFPAGTLMYAETRDLGATVDAILSQVKLQLAADGDSSQMLTGIEQQLGTTLDKALDFVEDAGMGVSFDGQQVSAGIVATLNDEAGGGRRIQTLLGLLRLVGGGANAPFTVTNADVDGTTVTTIALKPGTAGSSSMPFEPAISIAISDGHLYLGVGDFAAKAIAQDQGTSLATDPRFVDAVQAAGTPNAGMVFVDIAGAAPLLAAMAGSDDDYRTNVQPWVDALDTFVATATVDGDIASMKALLFVK